MFSFIVTVNNQVKIIAVLAHQCDELLPSPCRTAVVVYNRQIAIRRQGFHGFLCRLRLRSFLQHRFFLNRLRFCRSAFVHICVGVYRKYTHTKGHSQKQREKLFNLHPWYPPLPPDSLLPEREETAQSGAAAAPTVPESG